MFNVKKVCDRCGTVLKNGFCKDLTCPFSNHKQDCLRGWSGHPEKDPFFKDDDAPTLCTCKFPVTLK